MTFGEKIQKLRREAGLSQESFAEQLGVSRAGGEQMGDGPRLSGNRKMIRISKLFHVTLDYLLDDETPRRRAGEKFRRDETGRSTEM